MSEQKFMENYNALNYSVANTHHGIYICHKCGYIGKWNINYKNSNFICENCKHIISLDKISCKNKHTIRNYNSIWNIQYEYDAENDILKIKCKDKSYIDFNEMEIISSKQEYDIDFKDINSPKNRAIINKFSNERIEKYYNDNHKEKISICNQYYNNKKTRYNEMMLEHKNLTVLREIGFSEQFIIDNSNKFDLKATSPKDILRLPKKALSIIKSYFINDYFMTSYYSAIINYIDNKIEKGVDKKDIHGTVNSILKTTVAIRDKMRNANDLNPTYYMNSITQLSILIHDNNYNIDTFMNYLDSLLMYQAIEPRESVQLLFDYIRMNNDMNLDFDKYPKSLKLQHDITLKNYRVVSSEIQNQKISELYKKMSYLSFKDGDYIIVRPSDATDIIEEGKTLHHCVGSYVDRVINRQTTIAFMREESDKDKRFITIEIQGNSVVQAHGEFNRGLNEKEKAFVKKYEKHLSNFTNIERVC